MDWKLQSIWSFAYSKVESVSACYPEECTSQFSLPAWIHADSWESSLRWKQCANIQNVNFKISSNLAWASSYPLWMHVLRLCHCMYSPERTSSSSHSQHIRSLNSRGNRKLCKHEWVLLNFMILSNSIRCNLFNTHFCAILSASGRHRDLPAEGNHDSIIPSPWWGP